MLLSIDDRDPRPAYQQIVAAVKEQVRLGTMLPGNELPSVRDLARDLGINLHTARHAYLVLSQEGVLRLRLGRRARIAPLREEPASEADIEQRVIGRLRDVLTDAFHLGVSGDELRKLFDQVLRQQ